MSRSTVRFALASLAGFGALSVAWADSATFTCPDVTLSAAPSVAQIVQDGYSGPDDVDASNRLRELVAELRRTGTKPAFIVDQLIAAYCPLVATDMSLTDQEKVGRVRVFSRRVTEMAYLPAESGEIDVLVTVPLTPTLLGRVDEASRRAGMSRDHWLEQAINRQLTGP